ncbi:MAG: DUF3794 domain-containing protein [Clostridia bacterium]|nr:DUF3794 domain-containing protein [Clostridia bacterium]
MDFSVKNERILADRVLTDESDERPVDCDFVLPDYDPDVSAVLKCVMKPMVQSRQRSADRYLVDGIVSIRVLYLDEGRCCVRCCEFTQPFSSSFLLKSGPDIRRAAVSAQTDYVNCRAVSPRRLDVHGAFTVKLTLYTTDAQTYIENMEGQDVYVKTQELTYTAPGSYAEKTFSVNETGELGADLPPAEFIIRADTVALLRECRRMNGKAIIKGEVRTDVLYCADAVQGKTVRSRLVLPFSQIVDAEGMTEEWNCDAGVTILANDVRLQPNQNGENTLLSVSVKLLAFLNGEQDLPVRLAADAYSCRYPLQMTRQEAELEQAVQYGDDEEAFRQTVPLPSDGVAEVLDVWAEIFPAGCVCEDGQTTLSARVLFCMLTRDTDGQVNYYEKMADYARRFACSCDGTRFRMEVTGCDFSATGNGSVELTAQIHTVYRCFRRQRTELLTDVQPDEEGAFAPDPAAVKVCFAHAGEDLWEIAKNSRTPAETIRQENGLTSDILAQDTVLLIPLC